MTTPGAKPQNENPAYTHLSHWVEDPPLDENGLTALPPVVGFRFPLIVGALLLSLSLYLMVGTGSSSNYSSEHGYGSGYTPIERLLYLQTHYPADLVDSSTHCGPGNGPNLEDSFVDVKYNVSCALAEEIRLAIVRHTWEWDDTANLTVTSPDDGLQYDVIAQVSSDRVNVFDSGGNYFMAVV